MIRLESGLPEELYEKGYWYRPSSYFIFIIKLEIQEGKSVKAIAYEVETHHIDIDILSIKNGDEVEYFDCRDDWWLEIDIWGKYYFPKFNEEMNQWYHQHGEDDNSYIADFCGLLKATYDIAMKESKLKTY